MAGLSSLTDSATSGNLVSDLWRDLRYGCRLLCRTRASAATVVGDTATGLSTGPLTSISAVDTMIENVSKVRGTYGAVQNRLEHRLNNLATYQENLVASESRIRVVDMAQEMVNFTKLGILQQAGTSMLAQANQAPQGVLSLLQ